MIRGPVDVAMPTWNSAKHLRRALSSIRGDTTFPVGRIFVVDRASTDGTREIAAEFGCEVLTDTVSLGSAREKGFAAATTEWVALVDSDVELYDGWFRDVASFSDLPDAGALQPTPVADWMRRDRFLADYRKRLFPDGRPVALPPGGRGYTYCTVLRRALLAGVPLSTYEAYEDKAISDAVQAKGKTWWIVPVFPTHYVSLRENADKARWNAAGRRDQGLFRPGREALATLGSVKDGLVASLRYGDARFLAHAVAVGWNSWRGYARPRKWRKRKAA